MAAKSEQVLGTSRQRRVQIQSVRRPGRANAGLDAKLIKSNQHDGAVVFLSQPASDQANHAGVPAVTGKDQGRIAVGIELFLDLLGCGQLNAAFQAFATAVQLMDVFGKLLGPLARIGRKQLNGELRLAKSSGRVQPRGETERDI